MLEAVGGQQRQRRLMDARLGREIGAAGADQRAMLLLQPRDLDALMLQHELLHVDDALAALPRRRRQHLEELAVLDQEIGMLAEIGGDLGGAAVAARRKRSGALRLGFLVLGHDPPHAPLLFRGGFCFAEDRLAGLRPVREKGGEALVGERDAGTSGAAPLGGRVPTCAPIFAASTTWMGWRIEATSTSVLSAG